MQLFQCFTGDGVGVANAARCFERLRAFICENFVFFSEQSETYRNNKSLSTILSLVLDNGLSIT